MSILHVKLTKVYELRLLEYLDILVCAMVISSLHIFSYLIM